MNKAQPADVLRKKELAQIHIARQQLGMDRDTYQAMLWSVARVRSAADLDWTGRKRVMDHLMACGAKIGRKAPRKPSANNEWAFIDRMPEDRRPMLRKLAAMARRNGLSKAYMEGIGKQMGGFNADAELRKTVTITLEMMDSCQLCNVLSAVVCHLRRQGKREV